MKDDEKQLLEECREQALALGKLTSGPRELINPGEISATLGIHPRRSAYIFEKWTRKGWYEYGTSVHMGWMTPEGLEETDET